MVLAIELPDVDLQTRTEVTAIIVFMHSSYIEPMDLAASFWTISYMLPRLPFSPRLLGTALSPCTLTPLVVLYYGKSLTESSP